MFTGTNVHIRHVAECPEVAPAYCAEAALPAHMHDQEIAWLRMEPGLTVGLGAGWQISGSLPLDVRAVSVAYETLDGAAYSPPYADIHHRDEVLWGPVDGTLTGKKLFGVGEGVLVGVGVGSTLPFGRTEEDPYALSDAGLTHQHMQLGTGTFVPMVSVEGVLLGGRWGGVGWVNGRLPLYANRKGYQPAAVLSGGFGPSFRVVSPLTLLVTAEGSWEGVERWSGTPYGGRATILGALGATWSVSPALVLQAQARVTAWQHMAHADPDEGSAVQPFLGTAGLSWTFGAR